MEWQIEPMPTWPYPDTGERKGSPFRAKFDATLALLIDELEHLQVVGAVAVRVVADAADVRRDGMLRARASVRHPGVALSFTSATVGALTYPCDTFAARYYGESWQVNLRAIALGLEKLRTLDRYGITSRGEQYAGWRAIGGTSPTAFDTLNAALRWLRSFTNTPDGTNPTLLCRRAVQLAHPDVGGDPADWDRVDSARRLIDAARQESS